MAYGWSGEHAPKEAGREPEVVVVTPVGAAECIVTTTRVDDDLYILTLDGGGRLTIQGSRDDLRRWAVRLVLTFAEATENEELANDPDAF